MPGPGGSDDVFQPGVFGLPAQLADRLFRGGNQPGGIAGTARLFNCRNSLAAHLFAHPNHFAHGVTVAVAEVVKALAAGCQSEPVRLGEVEDMNIIPNMLWHLK